MKKLLSIILAILMIVTTVPIAFAAEEMTVLTEFCVYEDDYSYPGGWSNDSEENYHLGIQDEGKTAWEEGDELLIIFNEYDTDTWKKINTQTALLRYENEQFNGSISFVYDENSYIETYGCIGKGGGTDEYINIYCKIIDNVLYIVFPDSRVHYSRLRIVGEANTSYDVTVDGFFTADNFEKLITQNYTLTTDNNGNAYLYGIFIEGAILSVNGVSCTFDPPEPTISEKSYAVCAVHNFSDGYCTECYVKCAHANCSNSVCNDCGYICLHSDTLVQVEAKAPTCTQVGNEAYEYCTTCDYTTYVELPAITHTDANCDYKCDFNCGYEYETLDFSDAKVLSTNNGYLYIDGEKISVVYNTFDEPIQKIPGGKYILEGDMNSSGAYASMLSDAVSINLNGYTWDFGKKYLSLYVALSIYDTSIGETGKMTSSFQRTVDLRDGSELNLYSGTVENNSENDYSYSLQALTGTANLYGGKLKSNKYAINCNLRNPEIINLVGTVLESGEGYGQLRTPVTLYDDEIPEIVIDVSDYNGIDLTLQLDFYEYTDYVGKYTLIKGVENAEEAEKYKIKINYPEYQPDVYVEEIGYDEATGEIYLYTATNAFTQQPSVENDYTVDFNNPDVSFQWCEVEENHIGKYTAEEFTPLFSYDFKAGDILKVSTDSELRHLVIEAGNEYIDLLENEKTATITFDADTTVDLFVAIVNADNPVEVNFTVFKEAKLDGETEKTLQKVECGKSYYCKATVGENVYLSDVVTVGHNIVSVDAKAPTCTQVGNEAYEYCTACDYTTYVELPADPDAHTPLEAVTENEVAPKCDVAGSYDLVVYCDDCGAELDRDTKTVDALKHSFTKYEVTEEAKCGVEGKEVAYCDNGCGETDEKVIDALTHTDADGDYICDNGCGHEFEKPAPEEPTPDTPDEPTDDACDHLCHKDGFMGFIWKIVQFFQKLFKINPVCECGAAHY